MSSDESEAADFSCNICLCTCVEPVITLCGHLFCWPCIYRWMDSGQAGANECPVCKAGITRASVIPMYGRGGKATRRRTPAEGQAADAPRAEGAAAPAAASSSDGSAASAASSSSSSASAAASASAASSSSSSSSIPERPAAQRPAAAPRPAQQQHAFFGGGAGMGPGFHFAPFGGVYAGGGGMTFFSGFGLIPSLLAYVFSSMQPPAAAAANAGHEGEQQQQQTSHFGNAMLFLGIFVILMLMYA